MFQLIFYKIFPAEKSVSFQSQWTSIDIVPFTLAVAGKWRVSAAHCIPPYFGCMKTGLQCTLLAPMGLKTALGAHSSLVAVICCTQILANTIDSRVIGQIPVKKGFMYLTAIIDRSLCFLSGNEGLHGWQRKSKRSVGIPKGDAWLVQEHLDRKGLENNKILVQLHPAGGYGLRTVSWHKDFC